MADLAKQVYAGGGVGGSFISDFKSLFSLIRTRRTMVFAYGFMFTVIAFTSYIAFSPSQNSSSPWFNNIFSSSSSTTSTSSDGSQFSSFFSYLFPNSSQPIAVQSNPNTTRSFNTTTQHQKQLPPPSANQTITTPPLVEQPQLNQTVHKPVLEQPQLNQTVHKPLLKQPQLNQTVNATKSLSGSSGLKDKESSKNGTLVKGVAEQNRVSNYTSSLFKHSKSNTSSSNSESAVNSTTKDGKLKFDKGNVSISVANTSTKDDYFMFNNVNISRSMMHCDIFDGNWVKDDSYPLFPAGSCPLIDEQFNCYVNGRPDKDFQKLRWQPNGCNIPRLKAKDMLELLRGKRLVFVGDSLNRNMWESLICILRNSISDKSKVFEASGRREFRTDNSYLFVFKDYNCTVEFFRSPFLVQEWEMPETNGLKKETLRLDLVEKSSSKYKDADYIVFNTGHWWTHEKTSKGKDYYQEGSHVYGNLNVVEAFRKALTTWARWVDANINSKKSLVLFRGYSASHFHGGQWNSGGQCDDETEPIRNDTYLTKYPPKMRVLEKVLNGMKTPVAYLNITRMTDYRKDAHPSIYRKQNLSEEERKSPLRFQDCSHWCLPGVPDAWNELLYAQLLIKQYQKQQQQQKPPQPQQQKQKKKP